MLTSMPRFAFITLTFHENSNHWQENYYNFGVGIPAPFFLPIFKFFSQNWEYLILPFFIFWYVENIWFYCYLIWKTWYSEMVQDKDLKFFYWEFENEKKKDKTFLTLWSGDLNPRFSVIFPPMIWIFIEGKGDKVKSKQASKIDRTLLKISNYLQQENFVKL